MPDSPYVSLPEHVTVPLLTLVTRQSLDQDYATVAERRSSQPEDQPRRSSWVAAVVVLTGFGLLVSTAAVQQTRQASVEATTRSALISQLDKVKTTVDQRQERQHQLADAVARRQSGLDSVSAKLTALDTRVSRLQARTGYGPVHGAGVRIVVNDAPSGLPAQTVRHTDLALLVDALWGVGAEGIMINDQRLTPLSAIGTSNGAINVNNRPLSPPYVVEAVGDVRSLQSDLAESPRGKEFFRLVELVGLPWEMHNVDDLTLVPAPMPTLRWVEGPGQGENETSPTTKEADS